jgi:hypothetical protein
MRSRNSGRETSMSKSKRLGMGSPRAQRHSAFLFRFAPQTARRLLKGKDDIHHKLLEFSEFLAWPNSPLWRPLKLSGISQKV